MITRKLFFWFLLSAFSLRTIADTLAIERFEPAVGTLHETSGGSGWYGNWFNQGEYTGLDGWVIADTDMMDYPGVTEAGNYCSGGYIFTTTGRYFNVDAGSPFYDYADEEGRIGQGSFYFTFLIRKEADNEDPIEVIFADSEVTAAFINTELVKMGYFGTTSNSGGDRYWSLAVDNDASVALTNEEIAIGETYRMVVEINFGSTTDVNMWVNPPIDQLPVVPDASVSSTSDLGFWNIVLLFEAGGTGHGSFDEFIFTDDLGNVLPVEYTEISASAVENGIDLQWTTATEISNDRFIIERLQNEDKWKGIGVVDGNGDSGERISYAFRDESPALGLNFYRLVQVDYDGQRHISKTVSANYQESPNLDISIYQKGKELVFVSNSKIKEVSISDLRGTNIVHHFINQKEFSVGLARREKSVYLIVVNSVNGTLKKKVFIQ
ncbi:MAG: hypothetical protein ABJG78_05590 [Cyclobacteriaceae bacterium]